MVTATLDYVLNRQLTIAWAGERGEEQRLGWWRCDMVSQYGGQDLFRRLLPNTWQWATLLAAREAARRTDAESRRESHDADAVLTLFWLGADVDRRLDERLADLVRSGVQPVDAMPDLANWMDKPFDRSEFLAWVQGNGDPQTTASPVGRRLKGSPPGDLADVVSALVAALAPLSDSYPLPHFRREA
jgi:hypothetical protein